MSCTKNCKRNKIIREENIECRSLNFKNLMFSKKLVKENKLQRDIKNIKLKLNFFE